MIWCSLPYRVTSPPATIRAKINCGLISGPLVQSRSIHQPTTTGSANRIGTNWEGYRNLVEDALCNRSKDIELGLFLVEANTRVHGFMRTRWSLDAWRINSRIPQQWPSSPGRRRRLEIQYNKLHWLNDKFPDVICEIPLTWRSEPEINYSLNYFKESRRQTE